MNNKNLSSRYDTGKRDVLGRPIYNWKKDVQRVVEKSPYEHNVTSDCPDNTTDGIFPEEELKNMDCLMLSLLCLNITQDENINWETVSQEKFTEALNYAALCHKDQTRMNRKNVLRTPYIEHPLRNTLRAYRWGFKDGDILVSIPLHDTVEDCADKITGYTTTKDNKHTQREEALNILSTKFSPTVSHIVHQVSNPLNDNRTITQAEKIQQYADHLDSILHDQKVFVVKLSDYVDNAGGLHHQYDAQKHEKFFRLYDKYNTVWEVFRDNFDALGDSFTDDQYDNIDTALQSVRRNLDKLHKYIEETRHKPI